MSSTNPPRRPSSRGNTPRPRRIAGQGPADAVPEAESDDASIMARQTPSPGVKLDKPEPKRASAAASLFAGAATTKFLTIVLGAVALLLVLQGAWFGVHQIRNDDGPSSKGSEATIETPADRPIMATDAVAQEGAAAAAEALSTIVARKYKSYDEDVAKATDLMTESFAKEYQETTDQIRDEFIANRTTVQARVVAQAVVRANASQLQALVFLNQYVTKGKKSDRRTTYTPYRALVTMIDTEHGWIVAGLETK